MGIWGCSGAVEYDAVLVVLNGFPRVWNGLGVVEYYAVLVATNWVFENLATWEDCIVRLMSGVRMKEGLNPILKYM